MKTVDPGFTEYVLTRGPRLRRAAYLLCGSPELAEDLLQEALIALAERWGSVQNPDAFVRRVVYRQRVSWWRKHRREVVTERLPEPGMPDGTHQRAQADEVREALRALPPRQRAAVVLRYFEDLTVAQTAEVMGVRPGTVKSLSHHAVATLRELLGVGEPAAVHEKESLS